MHTFSVDTLYQLAAASPFYASLAHDFERTGGLTAKQIACLKETPLEPAAAPVQASIPMTTPSKLELAFEHAVEKGVRQPVVKLLGFKFMLAGERAQAANKGAIFVTSVAQGEPYLGKVLRGEFFGSRLCTPSLERSIRDAMDEPFKAATEYGFATGQCSICSRPLSNETSVKLGIGPVCRAKFGL